MTHRELVEETHWDDSNTGLYSFRDARILMTHGDVFMVHGKVMYPAGMQVRSVFFDPVAKDKAHCQYIGLCNIFPQIKDLPNGMSEIAFHDKSEGEISDSDKFQSYFRENYVFVRCDLGKSFRDKFTSFHAEEIVEHGYIGDAYSFDSLGRISGGVVMIDFGAAAEKLKNKDL